MNNFRAPRPWKPGDKFEAAHLQETVDLAAMAGPLTGGNVEVIQGVAGRSINTKEKKWPYPMIPVKITGSVAIAGTATRWKYTWVQQRALMEGKYEDVPGGFTNASTYPNGGYAYNDAEAYNPTPANTVMGNQVNMTAGTVPNTAQFKPIRGNVVVWARRILTCDGAFELRFYAQNGVDAPCP
jgi:hypothetical protein